MRALALVLFGALLAAGVQTTNAAEQITGWARIGVPASADGGVAAGATTRTRDDETLDAPGGDTISTSPRPTAAASAQSSEAEHAPLGRPKARKRGEELVPNVAPSVPARSGNGRRAVFSMAEQRVWIVGGDGRTQRTYLVSGSLYDNLHPGKYRVYSRSRHATSFTLSSTMEYFVRFTEGENAAIGFHSIPVTSDGSPVQTRRELGTPLSAGCIRQTPDDARAMWQFADIGTRVVVVA